LTYLNHLYNRIWCDTLLCGLLPHTDLRELETHLEARNPPSTRFTKHEQIAAAQRYQKTTPAASQAWQGAPRTAGKQLQPSPLLSVTLVCSGMNHACLHCSGSPRSSPCVPGNAR